jgi:hypothetical protein
VANAFSSSFFFFGMAEIPFLLGFHRVDGVTVSPFHEDGHGRGHPRPLTIFTFCFEKDNTSTISSGGRACPLSINSLKKDFMV